MGPKAAWHHSAVTALAIMGLLLGLSGPFIAVRLGTWLALPRAWVLAAYILTWLLLYYAAAEIRLAGSQDNDAPGSAQAVCAPLLLALCVGAAIGGGAAMVVPERVVFQVAWFGGPHGYEMLAFALLVSAAFARAFSAQDHRSDASRSVAYGVGAANGVAVLVPDANPPVPTLLGWVLCMALIGALASAWTLWRTERTSRLS